MKKLINEPVIEQNKNQAKEEITILDLGVILDYPKILSKYSNANSLREIEDEAGKIAMIFDQIYFYQKHNHTQSPEHFLDSIKELFAALSTTDPNKVHHNNVRSQIKTIQESIIQYEHKNASIIDEINDANTIDPLSRDLLNFCKTMNENLNTLDDGVELEKNGIFIWEEAFLNTLKKYGKEGKDAAKSFADKFKSNFEKNGTPYPIDFWVSPCSSQRESFHLSDALQLVVWVIWEEKIKKRINSASKNPPGTTTNVTPSLTQILNPKNKIKHTSKSIQLHNTQDFPIGSMDNIAAINTQVIDMIIKQGETFLKSMVAVRLIKYLITEVHERLKLGIPDYSDLKFPGRGRQIAQCLGMKSNRDTTTINTLLLMFDQFKFNLPGITSRLINIAECKPQSRYSAKGGWIITVLPPLRPHKIFTEKGAFIVPLLKDPPLVGHAKYHARLYILQWKITEEFVKQSDVLAQHGYVEITKEDWTEWLYNLDIPEKNFSLIYKSITGENGYLENKGKNLYSLKNENKPLKFLKEQGERRINGSLLGKNSAKKKRDKLLKSE